MVSPMREIVTVDDEERAVQLEPACLRAFLRRMASR